MQTLQAPWFPLPEQRCQLTPGSRARAGEAVTACPTPDAVANAPHYRDSYLGAGLSSCGAEGTPRAPSCTPVAPAGACLLNSSSSPQLLSLHGARVFLALAAAVASPDFSRKPRWQAMQLRAVACPPRATLSLHATSPGEVSPRTLPCPLGRVELRDISGFSAGLREPGDNPGGATALLELIPASAHLLSWAISADGDSRKKRKGLKSNEPNINKFQRPYLLLNLSCQISFSCNIFVSIFIVLFLPITLWKRLTSMSSLNLGDLLQTSPFQYHLAVLERKIWILLWLDMIVKNCLPIPWKKKILKLPPN